MASKQRTTTAIFAFITVLAFKLLSRKVLFMDRKAESCSLSMCDLFVINRH